MDMSNVWESAFLEKILAGIDMAAFDPKDTEKFYLREMKELRNRAEAVINTHYEGQGYMPVDLMVDIINQIKPTSGQKVAVFDRISALMMKMVGCDVTLFDKGAGFVNSGMKFDAVIGNPPYGDTTSIYPYFVEKALSVLSENGQFAMIIPAGWVSQGNKGKYGKKMRGILKDETGITIKMNKLDVFENAKVQTISIGIDRSNVKTDVLFTDLRGISESFSITDVIVFDVNPIAVGINKKLGTTNDWSDEYIRINEELAHNNKWKVGSYRMNRDMINTPFGSIDVIPPHKNKLNHFILGSFDTEELANEYAKNAKSFWHSKTVKFLIRQVKSSYVFATYYLDCVPKTTINKEWSDIELYKHFKLTKDEIEYIEANTK